MNLLFKKFNPYFLALLFSLCSTNAFAAKHSVPLFKAEYKLTHNDIEIGHVALSVTPSESGQYQLKSATETSGILAFVRDDDVLETSLFELTEEHIRPLSYHYQQALGNKNKNISLQFNWQKQTLTNSSQGQDWTLTLTKGVLDKALMQVALMLDLNNPATQVFRYKIADGGKLKTYAFSRLGTEKIDIGGTEYDTVKLARQKGTKPLITYYWCAPELHNLPILLQREKSYGTFEMRLINVKFNN
ncbi:MAG: hypothetical protein AXW16_00590 [Cycloclasticus sp. Phe_18]|nr:MAG: hypothetical protein AXW16_00590 [Cycloclasticus sp. Phe_18]